MHSEPTRAELKDRVFLQMAIALGQLGTCDRARCGAIITKDGRCVSWGYNGAPPGLPHCSETGHGWLNEWPGWKNQILSDDEVQRMGPTADGWAKAKTDEHGCRNATHAEANAVAFAARQGISTDGGTLYVERSPCANCARLIVAAGIMRVVYEVPYRDTAGIELLEQAGVEIG